MKCWWKSFHQRSLYPIVNNIYRYERFKVTKKVLEIDGKPSGQAKTQITMFIYYRVYS